MDDTTSRALSIGGPAGITTIGRRSGQPHRIEIVFHEFDGDLFISGRPGFRRDWLANLSAEPRFTLHLGQGGDVSANAEIITDPERRASLLYRILTERWGVDAERAQADLARWVDSAPLIQFRVHSS